MNPLAEELNKILEGTAAFSLLSAYGKRFYFPKGIVVQSGEAKKHAKNFNATIGMACEKKEPIELSAIKKELPGLSSSEAVAYAPTPGDPQLREIWKREICKKNPDVNPDLISQPVVVPGLTAGISQIGDLFFDAGDNLVVPDMFWGNYRLIFEGRKEVNIVGFPFFTEAGGLNVDGFEEAMRKAAVNGKVRLIVNFPNNPTGYSPSEAEADALGTVITRLAEEGIQVLAIMDDAYFGLFYETDTYTQSLFSKLYNAHKNIVAVKIDGATKEDFVWGFRLGFVTFGSKEMTADQYNALNEKLGGSLRASISNSSRPAQSIIRKALTSATYNKEKEQFAEELKKRYHKVREVVDAMPSTVPMKALPFNSGYFMAFHVEDQKAEELRLKLLHDEGIGTISIQKEYLRIAFASIDYDDIETVYNIIFNTASRL